MSLPAFASVEDLAARIPSGIADDDATQARAQAALDDASAQVRSVARKTWVTEDELDDDVPDIITTITLAAARRSFVNPDGVTQETTGPFSVSVSNASADVYLTKYEQAQIRAAAGVSGLWVLPTTRGMPETDSVYVDVAGSDKGVPVELPEAG